MNSFGDAWELICSYCKNKITDVAYNTWISRIKPLELDFDKNTAYLLVPTDFHRQTINRCYIPLLNEAFEAIFDNKFQIDIKIPEEVEQQLPIAREPEEEKNSNYEYTFDTFIVGSSNNFAHAACMAVATNPSNAYNPLFLYGNSGLGKTHLLFAIQNEIKKNYPDKVICYIKIDDFINELVESLKMKTMIEFRQKYRQVDVLLVDDVQFLGGKEGMQEEFFHTFNALYDAHKQIVLTSDRPPKEIKTLADRLRSRFEQDLIADIQPPDIETRIAIIKRKAELLDLELSNDVCEFIASKLKSNIRQLEGTVKKLKARYLLNHERITISSVQEVIADILNNDVPPQVTVERIIDEVARTFGFSSDEIRSTKSKSQGINKARQIAIYISRQMTSLSQADIGAEFGGRHYSTVIYSIDKTIERINTDQKVKELIDDIIKNIRDR